MPFCNESSALNPPDMPAPPPPPPPPAGEEKAAANPYSSKFLEVLKAVQNGDTLPGIKEACQNHTI